jgi:predicted RNA-binding protein associated with RNAse of E/G family
VGGYWRPGDTVAFRDIRGDRVGTATPMRVLEDGPERLVLYLAEGCTFYVASKEDGTLVKDGLEWAALRPLTYAGLHCIFFVYPADGFAIRATWMGQPRTFAHWYINLQEPMKRSSVGVSTSDQVLDLIIEPDRQTWAWKDVATFEAAVSAGRFTSAEAAAIRAEGLRAVEMARNGEPPFNAGWERWQPDPSWPIPVLPEGWEVV